MLRRVPNIRDATERVPQPFQTWIQIRRTTSRFFTGIAFIFCGSPFSCTFEAMYVPHPHRDKQSRTIAIFVLQFMNWLQAA